MKKLKWDRAANAREVLFHSAPEVITLLGSGLSFVADAAAISDETWDAQRAAAEAVRNGEAKTLMDAIHQQHVARLERYRQNVPKGEDDANNPDARAARHTA